MSDPAGNGPRLSSKLDNGEDDEDDAPIVGFAVLVFFLIESERECVGVSAETLGVLDEGADKPVVVVGWEKFVEMLIIIFPATVSLEFDCFNGKVSISL